VGAYVADESLKQHITFFEAAFPGYQLSVDDMVAEADKVAVRSTFTGTHRGELMGVPPTGKPVSIGLLLIYRIADGKIVEHWMQADTLGILQQIGAMPAPAY
jgi:predicted ester cyclase